MQTQREEALAFIKHCEEMLLFAPIKVIDKNKEFIFNGPTVYNLLNVARIAVTSLEEASEVICDEFCSDQHHRFCFAAKVPLASIYQYLREQK